MRVWLLCLLLAGCASTPGVAPPVDSCEGTLQQATLFLDAGHALVGALPASAAVFSNGFDEAFLSDDMGEWRSQPWPSAMRIVGNVSLEYWVRNDGTPAPVVLGGEPGQGYHWFNQLGTDRGFVPDYGREYADLAPGPGSIDHYMETIRMPPGGLHVEANDTLRILLTSLVLDDDGARGQHVLVGGDTPSAIRFEHHCIEPLSWRSVEHAQTPVSIHAHQGLITGAVPATPGVNHADVPFTLHPDTQRLHIRLEQTGDKSPLKDDMDITVLDADRNEIVSIGSPYADDQATFYAANLAHMMKPGPYILRVNSYSGHAYEGTLTVAQDAARLD